MNTNDNNVSPTRQDIVNRHQNAFSYDPPQQSYDAFKSPSSNTTYTVSTHPQNNVPNYETTGQYSPYQGREVNKIQFPQQQHYPQLYPQTQQQQQHYHQPQQYQNSQTTNQQHVQNRDHSRIPTKKVNKVAKVIMIIAAIIFVTVLLGLALTSGILPALALTGVVTFAVGFGVGGAAAAGSAGMGLILAIFLLIHSKKKAQQEQYNPKHDQYCTYNSTY